MPCKKGRKTLTFSERIQKTIDRHNKRGRDNMARYRAEQRRQGKKANEAIDIMGLLKK